MWIICESHVNHMWLFQFYTCEPHVKHMCIFHKGNDTRALVCDLCIVCEHATDLEATTDSVKTLKSYDRPSEYIQLVDCTWKIRAKDDHIVRFTVSQLDLGGCDSCGFLQIFDGQTEWIGTNLGKWRSGTPAMISSGKYMTVKFKTTKFNTNNGLIARYQAIPKNSG